MKKLFFIALMAFSCSSFAWKENAPIQKEYSFKFIPRGELKKLPIYPVTRAAASYEDAFDAASQDCFNHFKGSGSLSEDKGLDIVDTCANPRS